MSEQVPALVERVETVVRAGERWERRDFAAVPETWGVFLLEDGHGQVLNLVTTANLQRALNTRLGEAGAGDSRAELRNSLEQEGAVQVRFARAGSEFEADLMYLELARARAPHSHRLVLERWQAWCVHCDADAKHPKWSKYRLGAAAEVPARGELFGPLPDKHAAGRYMQVLEDAFDLCRYHHILEQAPRGTACAYKEMGRCPAPCDGTVSMKDYGEQIRASMSFAGDARSWREQAKGGANAGEGLLAKWISTERVLECTKEAERPQWRWVRNLRRLRMLSLQREPEGRGLSIYGISGGSVWRCESVADDCSGDALRDAAARVWADADRIPWTGTPEALEQLCVVSHHLFAPKAKRRGEFMMMTGDSARDGKALCAAAKKVMKEHSKA